MSECHFGQHFDIHGGGQDLQFPHHENEIAQSEATHDHKYVNYWIHNGFVRVDNEKMSKSLGNFFTIREVLEQFDAEVVRFFILRSHYRSGLNYSDQHLQDAKNSLTRLYNALKFLDDVDTSSFTIDWNNDHAKRFQDAMNDDFDSHKAITVLFELANEINKSQDIQSALLLKALSNILGLLTRTTSDFLKNVEVSQKNQLDESEIEKLIQARRDARANKNYAEGDRIRQELLDQGVILEDSAQGTTWRKA